MFLYICCFNLRENQKNKNTKPISKGGSETFKNFVFWFSRRFFFVFFGFLWYCWFSRCFFGFLKTLGKTKKNKNTKSISKAGSETFKNLCFLVVPKVFVGVLWFSLVVLVFPMFFCFSKNLRENQKNKKK